MGSGARLGGSGSASLDRHPRAQHTAPDHPREPPPPAAQRAYELRPPLLSDVRQPVEHHTRVAALADLQLDRSGADPGSRRERTGRQARQEQVLSHVPRADRPPLRAQLAQHLLREEQDRLLRIPARLLRSPAVEVALRPVGGDHHLVHRPLGDAPGAALARLPVQPDDSARSRQWSDFAHAELYRLTAPRGGVDLAPAPSANSAGGHRTGAEEPTRKLRREPQMSGVRLLVGTRKGGFVLSSDGKRKKWKVSGPHFAGWEIYHLKGSPADPDRIYGSQSSGWFGQVMQRSNDGGETWEAVDNDFAYDAVPGPHQVYDGTPHPAEIKRASHL